MCIDKRRVVPLDDLIEQRAFRPVPFVAGRGSERRRTPPLRMSAHHCRVLAIGWR
jgi:hypothetical protein